MNYLSKILSVVLIGVFSTLMFTLVQMAPAYACNNSACSFVLDSSTGFVFGHGTKISVHDTTLGTNPTITVNTGGNNQFVFTTGDYLTIDNANKNVTLSYPGAAGIPEYLMFTSATAGVGTTPLPDPPTLTSTIGTDIVFTYNDGNGNTISTSQHLVSADPPSGVTWPAKKTTNQPINNVAIQCTSGPRSGIGDFVCPNWKIPNTELNIPYTDSHTPANTVNYIWPCVDSLNHPSTSDSPFNPDPKQRLDWPCPGANGFKDVYVEVDWMKNHAPSIQALKDVRAVFSTHQINLHIQLGQEVLHKTALSGPNNGNDLTDFTKIKTIYFGADVGVGAPDDYTHVGVDSPPQNPPVPGKWSTCGSSGQYCISDLLTAKRQVFHYVLFGDSQGSNQYSSGISEVASLSPFGATNDNLISLGKFSYGVGSIDQQEGTFMHELGHGLGLSHSGPYRIITDTENCKPNYLSVMSYTRQFSDLFTVPGNVVGRTLDYSSEVGSINTGASFTEGPVTTHPPQYTVFGLGNNGMSLPTDASFADWDNDHPGPSSATVESQEGSSTVSARVLNAGTWSMNTAGSTSGTVTVVCPSTTATVLHTYDDWNNLMFDMTTTSSFADGAGNNGTDIK